MRFMIKVQWGIAEGNKLAVQGKLGSTVQSILEDTEPDAAYFPAENGNRSAVLFVELDDASQMPAIAEPWFLALGATVEFIPVMLPEDLGKAGPSIEAAVTKYAG